MRFLPLLSQALNYFIISAVIVLFAWVVWGSLNYPETLWAPGDLSRFHSDNTVCSDCHQPFHTASPDKCIACHTEHRGALAQITIDALLNPHGNSYFVRQIPSHAVLVTI
jgi:hypothetical protein